MVGIDKEMGDPGLSSWEQMKIWLSPFSSPQKKFHLTLTQITILT